MIHNPRMYPEVSKLSDLDNIRNNWLAHQSSILSVFEGRTGLKNEDLKALMEAETFLSAEDAVKKGFFDTLHDGIANYAALNYCPVTNLPPWATALVENSRSASDAQVVAARNAFARRSFAQRQKLRT